MMAILQVIKTIIRYECECPHCYSRLKSDDINSPFYGISDDEVFEIMHGDEIEIECPKCNYQFKIDEVDWE